MVVSNSFIQSNRSTQENFIFTNHYKAANNCMAFSPWSHKVYLQKFLFLAHFRLDNNIFITPTKMSKKQNFMKINFM